MTYQNEQNAQEKLYQFPYHYIPQFKDNFSMSLYYKWSMNYTSTLEFLIQKIDEDMGNFNIKTIADVGCGDGRFTRELHLKFPLTKIIGIDYSKRATLLAKGLNVDLAIDFLNKNIIEDKISTNFDAIVLMEVFEHIQPNLADSFLKGLHNLLKPGGIIYLTVPHENTPLDSHHFRHFNTQSLTRELKDYFEIIEIIPFEKISRLRNWLIRLMTNKYFIINHAGIRNKIYSFYKRKLFFVKDETQCQRIFVKSRKPQN